MASLADGRGDVQVVDLRNEGALSDLPADAVVEIPARIDRDGAHPLPQQPMGDELRELVLRAKAYERLVVEAIRTHDRDTALRALTANPLVGPYVDAEPPLTALLEANRGFLPAFASLGAAQASRDGRLRGLARLPGQQDLGELLHAEPRVDQVQVAAFVVDERLLVLGRPMRQPRDPAAALGGHDAAQRPLEVGLVLDVESMQLLGRQHPAQLVGGEVELVLGGREAFHRVIDLEVAPPQRIDRLGQAADHHVDALGPLEQLVAIGGQLLAVAEAPALTFSASEPRGRGADQRQRNANQGANERGQLPFRARI